MKGLRKKSSPTPLFTAQPRFLWPFGRLVPEVRMRLCVGTGAGVGVDHPVAVEDRDSTARACIGGRADRIRAHCRERIAIGTAANRTSPAGDVTTRATIHLILRMADPAVRARDTGVITDETATPGLNVGVAHDLRRNVRIISLDRTDTHGQHKAGQYCRHLLHVAFSY